MTAALIECAVRWVQHATAHPEQLEAEVLTLRRATGIQETDAHRALLADFLANVHKHIKETL